MADMNSNEQRGDDTPLGRRCAEHLQDSTERLWGLIKSSADWYWETDAKLCLVHLEFLGTDRAFGDATTPAWRVGQAPGTNLDSVPVAQLGVALRTLKSFRDIECFYKDSSGRIRYLSVSGQPTFGGASEFLGYQCIARDISEHRRGEQLRELEHAVVKQLGQTNPPLETMQAILRLFCESEDWEWSGFFRIGDGSGATRLMIDWHRPGLPDDAPAYHQDQLGTPVLTAIIASAKSLWMSDLSSADTTGFERFSRTGEHTTFAFPIFVDANVIGILAFGSRQRREPDHALLQSAEFIGNQVGQYLKRAEVEQTARENQSRLRTLIELSADWLWEQDRTFRFTYIAETPHRGAKLDAPIIGKARWELEELEAPHGGWDAHREMLLRHEVFRDVLTRRKLSDGTMCTIAVSGMPVFDERGQFQGYRGVAREVTAQVQADAALKESEVRFRTLTDVSSDWYWEQDAQFRYTMISDNAYRVLKLPVHERLGRRRWELSGLELVSHDWEHHRASLIRHETFRGLVVRQRAGDGKIHTLAVNGAPIFDDRGRFVGYRGTTQDITERVVAEQALRESEARFRTLTELSSDWYWEQDQHLRFTFVSDAAFRILGYGPEGMIGRKRWELPIEDIEGGWEQHKALLAAHRPFRDVMVKKRDANNWRSFALSGMPVFDAAGCFLGYRGISREVTAQVQAEEALRESERRVRLATQYAQIGIWERDYSTDSVRWSANIGAMMGCPGKTSTTPAEFASFVHPEDRDRFVRARANWVELDAPFDVETRIVWPDGTIRWVGLSGALERTPDGRPLRSLGVIQDITERKNADSILRESEERFRLLAEHMRDVFWIYNPRLDAFDYVTPSYETVWGQKREIILADATAYRSLVVAADASILSEIATRLRRGKVAEGEFRIRRSDGELRWLLVWSAPMTNSRGEQLICGITEDITERKLREQRRVEDALRQKDALIREVHHRVKNTLQGLIGMLRRHASAARATSHVIEMAITQLQSVAIVHGLQGLTSGEGLVLGDMLRAMTSFHSALSGHPVVLASARSKGACAQLTESNAASIALIFNELISNALKHRADTPDAITVQIGHAHGRARVLIRNRGQLPSDFNRSRGQRIGSGLRLVQTLTPDEGVRIAFAQRADMVEVAIRLTWPVLSRDGVQGEKEVA